MDFLWFLQNYSEILAKFRANFAQNLPKFKRKFGQNLGKISPRKPPKFPKSPQIYGKITPKKDSDEKYNGGALAR